MPLGNHQIEQHEDAYARLANLFSNASGGADSWVSTGRSTEAISMTFEHPVLLRAYGIRAGNDADSRSPAEWALKTLLPDGSWKVIHQVRRDDAKSFTTPWSQQIFFLAREVEATSLQLDVTANQGGDSLEIGQIMLFK